MTQLYYFIFIQIQGFNYDIDRGKIYKIIIYCLSSLCKRPNRNKNILKLTLILYY